MRNLISKTVVLLLLLFLVQVGCKGRSGDSDEHSMDGPSDTPTNTPTPEDPKPTPEDEEPTPTPEEPEDPTPTPEPEPPVSTKPRICILTDMGRGDPDDHQSMVHLLLYADIFDIECLIASTPTGDGNTIRRAVRAYAADYDRLKQHGDYPTPEYLMSTVKQGTQARSTGQADNGTQAVWVVDGHGVGFENEGNLYLMVRAVADDPRPLHVLIWGSATDLATALLLEPDVAKNIRVYTVGGWNSRQDRAAHGILWNRRNQLYWVDSNHVGGSMAPRSAEGANKDSKYGARGFIDQVIKGAGNLGEYYWNASNQGLHTNGGNCGRCIKEGDSPSFILLFPDQPGFDSPGTQQLGGIYPDKANGLTYWQDRRGDSVQRQQILERLEERFNRLR